MPPDNDIMTDDDVALDASALRAAAGGDHETAQNGKPAGNKTSAGGRPRKDDASKDPDRRDKWTTEGVYRWQEVIDEKKSVTGRGADAFEIIVHRIDPLPESARQVGYAVLGPIYGGAVAGTSDAIGAGSAGQPSAPLALYNYLVEHFHMPFYAPATYELLFIDKGRGSKRTSSRVSLPAPDDIRRSRQQQSQPQPQTSQGYGGGAPWPSQAAPPPQAPPPMPPVAPPTPSPIPAGASPEDVMRIVNADRESTLAWAERFRAMFSQGAGAMSAVPMSPPPAPDEDAAIDKMLKRFKTMRELGIAFSREDVEAAAAKSAAATAAGFEARLKALEGNGGAQPPAASAAAGAAKPGAVGAGAASPAAPSAPKTMGQQLREAVGVLQEMKGFRDTLDDFFGAGASETLDNIVPPKKEPTSKYVTEPLGVDGYGYRTRKTETDDDGNEIEPPPESLFEKATNVYVGSPKLQEMTLKGVMGLGKMVVGAGTDIARKLAGVPTPAVGAGATHGATKDDDDYPE